MGPLLIWPTFSKCPSTTSTGNKVSKRKYIRQSLERKVQIQKRINVQSNKLYHGSPSTEPYFSTRQVSLTSKSPKEGKYCRGWIQKSKLFFISCSCVSTQDNHPHSHCFCYCRKSKGPNVIFPAEAADQNKTKNSHRLHCAVLPS